MTLNHDQAEGIYAARALLEEGKRSPGALGVRELMLFLTSRDYDLSGAQTRSLFANPQLRETFRALKAQLVLWNLPIVVAASSDGGVVERHFEAGSLHLVPSRGHDHVFLTIRYEVKSVSSSHLLVIETPQGGLAKLSLPPPDSEGEVFLVLDLDNKRDASVIAALRDPLASGTFVRHAQDDHDRAMGWRPAEP
jgi:hypothetical protein